jgi:hypothetical protein
MNVKGILKILFSYYHIAEGKKHFPDFTPASQIDDQTVYRPTMIRDTNAASDHWSDT